MADRNIRIDEADHEWLKKNRGAESMKGLVHKAIETYKNNK